MLDNNLFWNVVMVISTTIEWLIFGFIIDMLDERRRCKKNIYIFFLIILIICYMTIQELNPNIKLTLEICIGCIFYYINYDVNKFKAVIINLIYWMILIGLDFISLNLILTINNKVNIQMLLKNNITRLELIIIVKGLVLSIIPVVKSFKYNINFKKKEIIHILVLISSNILSIVFIFSLSTSNVNKPNLLKIILLGVSMMLVLSNISLIKLIGKLILINKIEVENKIIREKINMKKQYYLNMQENQLKVRKLYHDMNNHMTCIEQLYGNSKEVKVYVDEIRRDLSSWGDMISTGNMILDIIINDKSIICKRNNIIFEVDISFRKCEFIDMIDICSIFSNLIDNAIEASLKLDEKERCIKLKGLIVKEFFVIRCENNKKNNINLKNGKIVTNKHDRFLHGIGIKSIKSSLTKYDGKLLIDYSKNKFIVTIYIPLK